MNYLQRKKLAFMSIVNQVKGFVRTVLGVPPLTLLDCVDDKSIIDYKIYGNSIQDGEPTPDNPIEVESVGEKTINLFDINSINKMVNINGNNYNAYMKNENGILTNHMATYGANSGYVVSMKLKKGLYCLSMNARFLKDVPSVITIGYNFKTDSNQNFRDISLEWTRIFYIFELTEDTEITSWNFMPSGNKDNYMKREAQFTNIMLSEISNEDERPDYEPYGKYKIPVNISGKNLFNINNPVYASNNSNNATRYPEIVDNTIKFNTWYANAGGMGFVLPMTPKTTFTISWENIEGEHYTDIFYFKTLEDKEIKDYKRFTNSKKNAESITYTQPDGYNYICASLACVGGYKKATIKNLQVEIADVATYYEPYIEPITTNIYLDEPLRKVGDYADYIDFENRKVVRNTALGHITTASFIHSKIVGSGTNKGHCCMTMNKLVRSLLCNTPIISMSFPNASNRWSSKIETIFNHTSLDGYLYLKVNWDRLGLVYDGTIVYVDGDETKTPLTDKEIVTYFTQYLNTLSEKEKEFICVGTILEEDIVLPTLSTFKGTTIYSIGTTIQPSNMEVTYYSTSKE